MSRCVFFVVLAFLLAGGCARKARVSADEDELEDIGFSQRTGLPAPAGGFVLAVGDETISSDEIVTAALVEHFRPFAQRSDFERFRREGRGQVEQVVVRRITDILLFEQARRDLGEDIEEGLEKAAEAEVRRFIVGFGGDYAKAEQALKQMGMDWGEFKEYQKKMILGQYYISSKTGKDKPITYSDLVAEYEGMKWKVFALPAMIKFWLIDIQPAKLKPADPNGNRLEEARVLAEELMGRLRGGEDFGELAKQYSDGHRASFGGLWKEVNPESLAGPYEVLAGEARRIKAGQIAGPIEAGGHIFIMKLEAKRAARVEPFEKVQRQVEAKISFERRREAVDKLGAGLMEQAAAADKGAFVEFCLEEIYRRCNR